MDDHALQLIDRIYQASIEPEVWHEVASLLSECFGGTPLYLEFLPSEQGGSERVYSAGVAEEWVATFPEELVRGVPWSFKFVMRRADSFGTMADYFGEIALDRTTLYTDWLKPQGFAAIWPAGHTIVGQDRTPLGGCSIFRREGDGPFTEQEFAFADLLVPHLRRAAQIHLRIERGQREQIALAEVMDRLPTGVILLDARRRPVTANRGAKRIAEQQDGFRLDARGPFVSNARENATLQMLIANAMEAQPGRELESTGFLRISRPSALRSYQVRVAPLLAAPPESVGGDAVIALFVTDPESGQVSAPQVLEELYALTHAEAELVRLLSRGLTLEESANERGVSLNTARSHLKHVFAKTGTSRQGELLRLVLTGVASMSEE